MSGHDYYTVRPHRDEADLDLEGNGDALALHARLRSVAFLDGGRLPFDAEAARRRARVSAALWRRAWPLVSKKWRTSDDGSSLVNDELLTEFDRVRVFLDRCSAGGRKGAPSRWPETQGKAEVGGSGSEQVPDTSCQEGIGLDWNGMEGRGLDQSAPGAQAAPLIPPKTRTGTPTSAEVVAYGRSKGLPEKSAVRFSLIQESKEWKGVVNWKPALEAWAAEDAERAKGNVRKTPQAAELDAEAEQCRRNREAEKREKARQFAFEDKVREMLDAESARPPEVPQ